MDEPRGLTLWIPQSRVGSGEPFWVPISAEQRDDTGASARPLGEPTKDGRVWVAVQLSTLANDGAQLRIPARGDRTIVAKLRVLPRGAGIVEVARPDSSLKSPLNIVVLVIFALVMAYHLGGQ
ncbi:MAG: hypothetical protein JKY37_08020 [Nannocystaceae bacterium]|nr:hypothetical protein [Nannocystaceae bacterium]